MESFAAGFALGNVKEQLKHYRDEAFLRGTK